MKATHQATALKSDGTRVNSYKLVYAHWPEEQLKILSRENSLPDPLKRKRNTRLAEIFGEPTHCDVCGSLLTTLSRKCPNPACLRWNKKEE